METTAITTPLVLRQGTGIDRTVAAIAHKAHMTGMGRVAALLDDRIIADFSQVAAVARNDQKPS